jgi:hypothetical protein
MTQNSKNAMNSVFILAIVLQIVLKGSEAGFKDLLLNLQI